MRVRTITKFKDLKEKKLRTPGTPSAEFECTEERYEEIKKFVEPIVDGGADVKGDADATPQKAESVQEEAPKQDDAPKKAAKAKKGSK